MNHFTDSNKYDYKENESTESEYEDESESESESEGLRCKNMDPALAKLMGIIIESQQEETDWIPPSKSGLDNSKEIISCNYFKNRETLDDIDFFKVIKDDIINYKTLTDRQLHYIKNINNEEKFELIEIYNKLLAGTVHRHK